MGLTVEILREMAPGSDFCLCQAAKFFRFYRFFQYITPDQLSGQVQNLSHRTHQMLCRQLTQNQFRFQRIHLPPECNPGVSLGYQEFPIQMGHVLRFFFQISAV